MKAPHYPDNKVTYETETGPSDYLPCQPAGDQANENNYQQAFAGHIDCATSVLRFMRDGAADWLRFVR
jgi:hypothetical protein